MLRVSDMMVAMTQRFEREAAKREASRDRHYFGATPGDAQAWRPAGHLSNVRGPRWSVSLFVSLAPWLLA